MAEKTFKQWDSEIKQQSLHFRFDGQLETMLQANTAKIPRVRKDYNDLIRFPDAKKKEVYESLVDGGEIEDSLDKPLSLATIVRLEEEYQSELSFYATKIQKLQDVSVLILKEQELRAARLVTRKPRGSTYYIDFDNGHDVDNDGSSAIKTNGDGPWATLDKATSILTASDKVIVRRGMIQTVTGDLAFANDGTIANPIIMEADFDNINWGVGGQDETTAGQTATLAFGSKTVTFAGDISGDISVGDWIYETTEDNRLFAYEVEAISGGSNEVVTLFLPYKGAISGAGKTIEIMPPNPIWNIAAGNYEVNIDSDHYWKFQGMHFRGTDGNGVVEVDSSRCVEFHDCILEGNGSTDNGIMSGLSGSDSIVGAILKCRFYKYAYGIVGIISPSLAIENCLFDGQNISNNIGIYSFYSYVVIVFECEFKNHHGGDIGVSQVAGKDGAYIYLRNCLLSSSTEFDRYDDPDAIVSKAYSEDHDHVLSVNKQYMALAGSSTVVLESETGTVRGGGGSTSIKVTPVSNMSSNFRIGRVLLFEYPIYAVKDVAKTYTVYFKSDNDLDWDADPTNTELWIEAEYWGHATNVARKLLKSTGVCNNFDADDTVWDTLTVTVTPLQTGVLYLRGYYAKTKEAAKSNIFFCDTKMEIS